jgi:hypothetical protein
MQVLQCSHGNSQNLFFLATGQLAYSMMLVEMMMRLMLLNVVICVVEGLEALDTGCPPHVNHGYRYLLHAPPATKG